MAGDTPPFLTFVHAGGENDTPENTRRGETIDEWWQDGQIVPAAGDVVLLGEDRWRVRLRSFRRVECARVVVTIYVEPVRRAKS